MNRIDELLQQREMIDAELRQLRTEAMTDLEEAQMIVDQFDKAIGSIVSQSITNAPRIAPQDMPNLPLSETDAGNGIGEQRDSDGSAQSFNDELAELRARSQARRRR